MNCCIKESFESIATLFESKNSAIDVAVLDRNKMDEDGITRLIEAACSKHSVVKMLSVAANGCNNEFKKAVPKMLELWASQGSRVPLVSV